MKNAMKRAGAAHRRAAEALYEDTCTVFEQRPVRDEAAKITKKQEVPVQEDMPCRLSFERLHTASMEDGAAQKAVSVKLFLAPEPDIKAGSKIVVTHRGTETAYRRSGVPAVYATHQEVTLELFERWV